MSNENDKVREVFERKHFAIRPGHFVGRPSVVYFFSSGYSEGLEEGKRYAMDPGLLDELILADKAAAVEAARMDSELLGQLIGALMFAQDHVPANHVAGLEDLAERVRAYREKIGGGG